jgi:GMP synthase-like glutamine amidotransferase
MRIHCFQHVAFENPGTILEWAKAHNFPVSYTYFYEADYSLPSIAEIDVLLVMGGYMNVDEEAEYPWLKVEKQFIKQAVEADKKVMGICLGSQLLASALGGTVYAADKKEIGFFPLKFTPSALKHRLFNHFTNPYLVFQWHGDTFNLPQNAQLVASSDACPHQAFMINSNVLALQFHFEMNETIIEDMLLHDGHELSEKSDFIQSIPTIKAQYAVLKKNKADIFLLLDKFLLIA